MDKTKLNKMEELDAKIEKINYDLLGLESRKKEKKRNLPSNRRLKNRKKKRKIYLLKLIK